MGAFLEWFDLLPASDKLFAFGVVIVVAIFMAVLFGDPIVGVWGGDE